MRFSLRTLLLSLAVVATSLGAFGPWGLAVAAIVLGAIGAIRVGPSPWQGVPIAVAVLGLLALGLIPAIGPPQMPSPPHWCENNLKQIGLALHNYHSDYGCFPPAYVADADGRPMHSWRVLILPYIEELTLYQEYDFSEPWDGANNRKLIASKPEIYGCPGGYPGAMPGAAASYVAVVGPETAWPGAEPTRLDDVRDGAAETILVVETVAPIVNWMEPKDLSFEDAAQAINAKPGPSISSRHGRQPGVFEPDEPGAWVMMTDGSVHFLTEDFAPETVRALLTVDGGETVFLPRDPPRSAGRPSWHLCVSLPALAISVLLLWWSTRPQAPRQHAA